MEQKYCICYQSRPSKTCVDVELIAPSTSIHKIFETNSSFHVKQHTMAKVQEIATSTNKIFISGGGLSTRQ